MTFPLMPHAIRQQLTEAWIFASATAGSSTGGAAAVTVPVDVRSGDVLLFINTVRGTQANTVPSGFTSLFTYPNSGWTSQVNISFKLANGSEGGASVAGVTGPDATGNEMLVIRGNAPIASVTRKGTANSISNNDPGAAVASASTSTPLCLALGVISSDSGTPYPAPGFQNAGTVPDFSFKQSAPNLMRAGVNFYPVGSTPVDQSTDVADNLQGNIAISMFLELR